MFKLPGSLPRSLIRKLRAKCLVQVKATLEDLEAQKRDYCERMAKQQEESHQQENQKALTSDEDDTKNPDKEVDEDSYSEEFDDNSDEENSDQMLKSPRQKDSADDIESSPSLNIITANHDNRTLWHLAFSFFTSFYLFSSSPDFGVYLSPLPIAVYVKIPSSCMYSSKTRQRQNRDWNEIFKKRLA